MNKARLVLLVGALVALGLKSVFAGLGGPPDWVSNAAHQPTPATVGAAPAVVLFSESVISVDESGTATRTRRFALRVLTEAGRTSANTSVNYLQNSSRVRTASAWLIRNGRQVKYSGRGDWVDASVDTFGALYSDSRFRGVNFSADAVAGDVFVAETEVTGPLLFAEDGYGWGLDGLPVVTETYRLRLPSGFTAATQLRGATVPAQQTSADGREITWTLRDQPFLSSEPNAPRYEAVAPMLLVRIQPAPGAKRFKPAVLQRWSDLATWTHRLNAAQCDRDQPLIETARRLTAGCTDTVDKLRALGGYVQELHYATLLEGLGKGLGVQPHRATQTLAQGYGDCKDKANLLCALLREAGVTACIAAARIDDEIEVQPAFPSASQFNHAIVAVSVDESVNLPAVVATPSGRLLFFDPTAEHTLPGDLPGRLQGTLVFPQTEGSDQLVRLPRFAPFEGHCFVRRATMNLDATGSLRGAISITGVGQAGAALRHGCFKASTDEMLKTFTRAQLGDLARGVPLQHLVKQDDPARDRYGLSFEIVRENYCQFLHDGLVVLRPELFARGPIPALTAPTRQLPIKLSPLAFDDQIEFALPDGMRPEELPATVALTSAFGSYQRQFTVEGRTIRLTRRLELKPLIVPAADYAALKKFLSDLNKADRASVVLRTTAS